MDQQDNHHKFVGFIFAYLGADVIIWMSWYVFDVDHVAAALNLEDSVKIKSHKLYVCAVLAIILGLIQLITSVFLTVKENFLMTWSLIHIGLGLSYMIMFLIIAVRIKVEDDGITDPANGFFSRFGEYGRYGHFFNSYFCQNFLLIIPVAAFNLLFKRMTQPVGFTIPPTIEFDQFGRPFEVPTVNFNPMSNVAGMPYTPSYQPQPLPYPATYPATNIPLNENARPADISVQP